MIPVSRSPLSSLSIFWALPLDVVCVLVFVSIGRSVHDHGVNVGGITSTAWPFLSGLAVGWGAVAARQLRGRSLHSGVVVCISTVAVGMVLRVVASQGTAFAFVLVALGFLGLAMLGWRLVAAGLARMRSRSPLEA